MHKTSESIPGSREWFIFIFSRNHNSSPLFFLFSRQWKKLYTQRLLFSRFLIPFHDQKLRTISKGQECSLCCKIFSPPPPPFLFVLLSFALHFSLVISFSLSAKHSPYIVSKETTENAWILSHSFCLLFLLTCSSSASTYFLLLHQRTKASQAVLLQILVSSSHVFSGTALVDKKLDKII